MQHSQGNWKPGKWGGCVVTNIPHDRIGYTWENKESEYAYYGGYLIAESIQRKDIALIAAAPKLLHALRVIVEANEDVPTLPYSIYLIAKQAVISALSEDEITPTPFFAIREVLRPMPIMIEQGSQYLHHSAYAKRQH